MLSKFTAPFGVLCTLAVVASLCLQLELIMVSPAQGQSVVSSGGDLKKVINDASEGEGNETALRKLKDMPRAELHRELNRIRNGLARDDSLRVKVAFVSCKL